MGGVWALGLGSFLSPWWGSSQFQWVSAWVRAPGESGPPSSGILLLSVLGERQLRVDKATGARSEPRTPAPHTFRPQPVPAFTASIPRSQADWWAPRRSGATQMAQMVPGGHVGRVREQVWRARAARKRSAQHGRAWTVLGRIHNRPRTDSSLCAWVCGTPHVFLHCPSRLLHDGMLGVVKI